MSQAEKENNSIEFYNFFAPRGLYTLECISSMLGNIDGESKINPGCKETPSDQDGWGLVQWTPATNLIFWCGLHGWDWYDGVAQCECLAEDMENPTGQWFQSAYYPQFNYTQAEFRSMTNIDLATQTFCWEYLRPLKSAGDSSMPYRIQQAYNWYNYLSGQPVPPTPPTPIPDIQAILMLLCKRRRLKPWS